MNLIQDALKGGVFAGRNVRIEGLQELDGPVWIGFRAGDFVLDTLRDLSSVPP